MLLRSLKIHNFRNLRETRLDIHPTRNFIFGDNAQGKTNLIETIYLLCFTKSFRTKEDYECVPFEGTEYFVEGDFVRKTNLSHHIGIRYHKQEGKQIKLDGNRINPFSKLIGQFPIVILNVDDYTITDGSPSFRRRYFNILLSQSSTRYLDDLKQYERVLSQRNLILSEIAVGNTKNQTQLEAWNTQLIQWGAKLMQARWAMVNDMNEILKANYTQVSSQPDPLRIEYMPNVACDAPETAKICLEQKLADISGKEKWRGTSLAGPHRDEFVFYIGSRDIRRYGSRGEHKSVLVSLKAAESRFLHRASGTPPIILLDDLYAELDNDRAGQVMSLFKDKSQVFVTGTSLDYKKLFTSSEAEESGVYFVENGVVSKQ